MRKHTAGELEVLLCVLEGIAFVFNKASGFLDTLFKEKRREKNVKAEH